MTKPSEHWHCHNCQWIGHPSEDAGECRKHPPLVNIEGKAVFPPVVKGDWCGEYTPLGKF